MSEPIAHATLVPSRAPRVTGLFNPVAKALLGAGLPLGSNALVTIRGRTSGEPRTTPLAIIEIAGRRWVWSPWGDVNWVRNLRAAGRATVTARGRRDEVLATELAPDAQLRFFCDTFGPYVRGLRFGRTFVRLLDGVDVNDPHAADGHPVFELRPAG